MKLQTCAHCKQPVMKVVSSHGLKKWIYVHVMTEAKFCQGDDGKLHPATPVEQSR